MEQQQQQKQNVSSLPGVQSYKVVSDEQWQLSATTIIVLIENNESAGNQVLKDTITLVESEFRAKRVTTHELPVLHGSGESAKPGDLVVEFTNMDKLKALILGANPDESLPEPISSETYVIEVGRHLKITAAGERAVMYGLRTVLQQLLTQPSLTYGILVDYPVTQERALHIDIGRKFFTKDWILDRVRELSWLKLNMLQLHFSENEGFTLQCDTHSEVMSPQYLTKAEVKEILETAKKYHVTVIPSLDSPGHLDYALRTHPEWLLKDASGAPAKGALDITNDEAKGFVLDLLDEYAELFAESPYFHIGGDEFIDFEQFDAYPQLEQYAREKLDLPSGKGVDTYIDYINGVAEHLEAKGFVVRAWNDGLYRQDQAQQIDPKTSIQITYWTKWHKNMALAQTFIDKGYELINYNDAYFYYVLGEHAGYKYPTGEKIYADWHPGLLPRISETEKQEYGLPYPDSLVGCTFSIWSDKPEAQTEQEVSAGLYEPLRAMAEKAWNAEKRSSSYQAFKAQFDRIGGI